MSVQNIAIQILKTNGPMLTGELAKLIAQRNKSKLGAATTAVSRLKRPIVKLKGIAFLDNQKYVYLEEQFPNHQFQEKLRWYLTQQNIAAGRALHGISARGGVIREKEFSIISGAPSKNLKKQLRDNIVLNQLKENRLIKTNNTNPNNAFIYDANLLADLKNHAVIFSLSDLLIEKCTEWCLRVGFTSSGIKSNRLISKDLPQFGLFNWDIVSPTYLNGLRTYNKKSKKVESGFFAADAIISPNVLNKADLSAFKNKVEVIKSLRGMKPFIPAIIHLGMEEAAINDMRAIGVMCLEPKSFGDPKLGEIIKELMFFMTNNAVFFKDQPRFEELIKKALSNDYGRLLNLPGPLFQMTLAFLFKQDGHLVEYERKAYSGKGNAEIDLWIITNQHELISVESKGLKRGKKIDPNQVIEWIEVKRPRIIEWSKNNYRDNKYKPVKFKFIISSEFEEKDLQTFQQKANAEYKSNPVEFLDISYVKKMAKTFNQTEILN
ncbi:MAG: hypothetical protein ACK41T_06525 [Pseudobdellovibrio sp.]